MPKSLMINYSPIAVSELENTCRYVAMANCPEVALKQKLRVKNEIARLGHAPNIGQPLLGGFRKLSIPPYVVIYKIESETINIIRVFDGRQDWQNVIF